MRRNRTHQKDLLNDDRWKVDQDCYLIENQSMSVDELSVTLPFNVDEIIARRQVLGLERRARKIMRMDRKEGA